VYMTSRANIRRQHGVTSQEYNQLIKKVDYKITAP
jgi:hypothetical protein